MTNSNATDTEFDILLARVGARARYSWRSVVCFNADPKKIAVVMGRDEAKIAEYIERCERVITEQGKVPAEVAERVRERLTEESLAVLRELAETFVPRR